MLKCLAKVTNESLAKVVLNEMSPVASMLYNYNNVYEWSSARKPEELVRPFLRHRVIGRVRYSHVFTEPSTLFIQYAYSIYSSSLMRLVRQVRKRGLNCFPLWITNNIFYTQHENKHRLGWRVYNACSLLRYNIHTPKPKKSSHAVRLLKHVVNE